jgi:hypothetical protein
VAYYRLEPNRASITGYHGTSRASAEEILLNGFRASEGPGEWLGHGVYFFTNPDEAWLWAEKKFRAKGVVIQATVVFGHCLDLDNIAPLGEFIREVHHGLAARLAEIGEATPTNSGDKRVLDCAVLNHAARSTSPPADCVRKTCPSGGPIFPGSSLTRGALQVCVRTIANILHPTLCERRT